MPRKTFRKEITSPELWEKVNKENKRLMQMFLKEKSTRSSELTIKNYTSNGKIFFTWNLLYNDNKEFTEIKKLDYIDFFSFATEEMKWGSSRANNMRSFLSSMSQFIERVLDDEYPDFKNVVLRTIESMPKEERREKTVLSDEEVEDLLNYLSEKDAQQACWFALAVCSGARFSELLRFNMDILDPNNTAFGDMFIESKEKIRTKGRGRSGKMLYKYILRDKFMPYYEKWILEREKIMKENRMEHNSLFLKSDGSPATDGTIRYWVKGMDEYLGKPLYPHAIRHFIVSMLTRKKIPQQLIIELMGWTSSSMYEIYNDNTAKDLEWEELDNLKQ